MKTTHTPGPWNMSKHGTPEHSPQFGIYADGCQEDLALVRGDNARADAVLIAAAPDLLDALKLAEATIDRLVRHAPGSADGTHYVIATAIAKAKGS